MTRSTTRHSAASEPRRGRWRVGIDTGGTFTDLVAMRVGDLRIAKVPSTPSAFERGVLNAIAAAGIEIGEIDLLAHGTTVATNAVITGEGSPTALLTTAGFRDVLELRRHNRGELYDILWDPPKPIVPRRHRFEVAERLDSAGGVLRPLEEEDVARAVRAALAAGINTFAICFLHSYVNAAHELRAKEIVTELAPHAFVYCSSDILREPGEFERTSTVVVNAYLGPVVSSYLEALHQTLIAGGFTGRLLVMHSGGGLLTAETAARVPARLVTSGPAAGAMAAELISSRGSDGSRAVGSSVGGLREDNVISLDMGGTSADIAVIRNGHARLVNEHSVEFGKPIRLPAVDLTTIGAGGGSIAAVDDGGLPSVGPRSATAVPGPAAYGLGGLEPTVTDANVVLGRIGADAPLAGGVTIDAEAARTAVNRFAADLHLSLEDAALGIVEITNRNMARAIRLVTVERGLDPRTFCLVSFGGAGGLHGAELAAMLGITRVVVPSGPGVTSALGCLCVDIVHDVAEAQIQPLEHVDPGRLREAFSALEARVGELLAMDGVGPADHRIERYLDLRYEGQRRALTLSVDEEDLRDGFEGPIRERFLAEYLQQFHYSTTEIGVELAALRVRGRGLLPRPDPGALGRGAERTQEGASVHRTVVSREGAVEAAVAGRSSLREGDLLAGPAIVHEYDATTWVPPGWSATVEAGGHLVMTRPEPGRDVAADVLLEEAVR